MLRVHVAPFLWRMVFLLSPLLSSNAFAEDTIPLTIQSVSSDLAYDEHNRLAQHHLLYDATSESCQVMASNFRQVINKEKDVADRFRVEGVEGHALDRVFGPYPKSSESSCRAACVERGTERAYAGFVMPNAVYDSQSTRDTFSTWFDQSCRQIEVCILSYHSKENALDVYWKRYDGTLSLHKSLQYGERYTQCFHSFLGHHFVAKDAVTGEIVGDLTVEYITVKAWGEAPPSSTRQENHDFVKEIEDTLKYEWSRHKRISRTFSPLGFKKGRLPPDVFASIGAFYYNNAKSVVREEWDNKGVFVNWWETDVMFVQIPWNLKMIYQERLKTMVEEWAGEPVEQTVMYGLRMYTEGARLLTHVDRHSTHAVSLIVNVAQGNLTEPWPVEVQDHANRMHEVIMEPGDVVYYESAKCLHARNRPMRGPNAYYVNLFTHYRPVGDPEWFKKPNPEGTPEPVLGDLPVTEECKLVRKGLTGTGPDGHSLGYVEGVECDNPRLGPYISPTLFQANGPEDMIEWWRSTGEGYEGPFLAGSTSSTSSDEL
ncbi:2-oxyglutarate/Fe(II) oxygenase [Nitzschia inconspicua]|uniref:2-oxyglutarate/Fe(II) oxygenase n=1 Tax=Nitzschia inconspicua TaxID=303405 RepID=A0A9K3LUN2_9STRA|nr:2-oxyglutarate/Fe(II) oxygenase [Nitzschia inconspicua]